MESIDSTTILTSLFTLVLLILGFWVLKEKGKGGVWYLMLVVFFTPIFWIIVGALRSRIPTQKTKIISIVSVIFGSLFLLFSLIGFPSNAFSTTNEIDIYDYDPDISFREYLTIVNESIDINIPNKFESLQPINKYSNYYFNFSTVFPDNLEIDRGMSEYSIIRGSNKDQAISVSLNVVPKNPELSDERIMTIHNSFQESPTTTLNNSVDGNYSDLLKTQFERNSGLPIKNLKTEENKIRTTNYFYYIFNYEEEVEGMVIEFIMEGFQTILWGNTYTFVYSTPEMFYDNSLLENVLLETNYIRPKSVANRVKAEEQIIAKSEKIQIECDRIVEFGNIKICLPEIEGMTECYSKPIVKAKADNFAQRGTTTLGYYLNNSIYNQLDSNSATTFFLDLFPH